MNFSNAMFGAEDPTNPSRTTEVEIFPRNVAIDVSQMPVFEAPPHTGNWTSEIVFVDLGQRIPLS